MRLVDGIDLTEDENTKATGEPNSVSLLKFNPEKKKRGLLELFRTHPRLEERIERIMFTITIKKLENLSEKGEQYLEKEFAKLEKITKKPREYHFKEALIRYINNEWGIRDEANEYIRKRFKGRKKPHDYHITEALVRYIEDMEDIRAIEKHIKDEKEGKVKYYTSEEVKKELKQHYTFKGNKRKTKRIKGQECNKEKNKLYYATKNCLPFF
ncbi:14274_t:CDS:2 [Cetraspora pellucida]|uniref:14274_t:CDS:1 n=1 Tax=Cetraspora pellucida TaxID=1433469 RepID=A0ACA9LMJ0_9GLOM|nr:14274_t:CDS:2 [Cetraspora pellucida]